MRTTTLAAIVALALPRALPAQAPVIDSVALDLQNIFSRAEAEASVPFAIANALHVRTHTWVVSRELLFRTGDRYDSATVAETERNLRALGLFRDVSIDTVRQNGRLVVRVRTSDGWTTNLNLTARSTGGTFTWGAGITERNALGTGHAVGVGYRHEADRNVVRLHSRLNRIFGTRLLAEGAYEDLTDGTVGTWALEMPLRSLGERWGFTLAGEAARQRLLQFRSGADTGIGFYRRGLRQRGEFTFAPVAGTGGYLRMGVGAQVRREEVFAIADTSLAIPDSVSGALRVFSEWLRPRFKVVRHYNGFARDEDLDLSTRIALGVWLAPRTFGYARTGVVPEMSFQTGVGFGRQFVRIRGEAHGLFDSAGLDSGRVRAAVTIASLALPRQAVVLHAEGGLMRDPVPGAEFDLGHGQGPRAFGPHAFTGTRALWGTLEHRWFAFDELAGLFGLGFAAFLDYGGAWFDGVEDPRIGGNVGLGLRIGATRSTGPNVGRIDVAWTFGDGVGDRRWVLSLGRSLEF